MGVNPQLVEQLRNFAKRGAKFEQAKESLMSAGWSEAEVMDASEQFSYLSVSSGGDATAGMTTDLKQAYGEALVGADIEEQKEQFQKDALQAEYGVGHTGTYEHSDSFVTWDLNIPWWVYYPGCVVVAAAAWLLKLPQWAVGIIVTTLVVWRIVQRYPRQR